MLDELDVVKWQSRDDASRLRATLARLKSREAKSDQGDRQSGDHPSFVNAANHETAAQNSRG
jgi:CRISPR/Cas system CMR-associated protein Cmr5 small subunit